MTDLLERALAKTDRTSDGGCWEWTGARLELGYGVYRVGTKTVRAHRYVYEQLVGPIPDGLVLDHLCRNPPCVNPAHLEPVTQRENIERGESVTVALGQATHCKRGHLFDEANTYVRPTGMRMCRACAREYQRGRKR